MTTKCIEMRNVTKKFRDFKLDNVSLKVPQGKIVGFIGENGAGKSTTINLLLNLIDKDSGEIEIFGLHYPKDETKTKQQIGAAFDECLYPEELTPNDMGIILSGIYKEWDNERYYQLLQRFSVPKMQTISFFSRGMKMKLDIIAAMSHHAKLLLSCLIFVIISVLGGSACNILYAVVTHTYSLDIIVLSLCVSVVFPLLWASVFLPSVFKFGIQSASYFRLLLIPALYLLRNFMENDVILSNALLIPVLILLCLVILGISFLISVFITGKRL